MRMRRAMTTGGRQPTSIESRNTIMPIEPTKTGTTMAQNDRMQRLSRANLKDRPSALKRLDSLAISRDTRKARKKNDTRSDELLKKKSV